MRIATCVIVIAASFALLLVAHGSVHLLGAAKAFGWAELPQLTQPVSSVQGSGWLAATTLFMAAAAALFVWPRGAWVIGACAIAVSTAVILPSWTDARFGAVVNVVAAAGFAFVFLADGPGSLRAEYEGDRDLRLALGTRSATVTDADLAHLPPVVQTYLRGAGVVGQPRVRNVRARMHGRIRSGPDATWMPLTAEQYNFFDDRARLFYLNASMFGVPVQGYHRYIGNAATMRVKAAGLIQVADGRGEAMTQAETVTMLNDMALLAPATLIDPAIAWQSIDDRTVQATFTNAGQTVCATLAFNDAGELIEFWSDDRLRPSDTGVPVRVRWSTPVEGYRTFGHVRLASGGAARWHEPGGVYAYIEITFDSVEYNVASR